MDKSTPVIYNWVLVEKVMEVYGVKIRMVTEKELVCLRECLALSDSSPTGLVWTKKTNRNVVIGSPALKAQAGDGYYRGRVYGKNYAAHRVVFFLYHGRWPDGEIDHINGDRLDNRPPNLREADRSLNSANRGKGYYITKEGTYRAQIKCRGKVVTKACYSVEEAEAWRAGQRRAMYGTDIWQG